MLKKIILLLIIFCYIITLNTSEYKRYKTSYKIDSFILAPSSIFWGYSLYKNHTLSYIDVKEHSIKLTNDFKFIDKYAVFDYNQTLSNLSDYLVSICILMPYSLNFGNRFKDNRLKNNFIISETYFATASLTAFSKTLFMRKRPYTYSNKTSTEMLQHKDANYSFFSAHTALAFTGAILFIKMNNTFNSDKNNLFINSSAIVLASSVAYLRYKSGNHFPTDIMTGILVGSFIAYTNLELHHNSHNSDNKPNFSIPMISFDINF